MTSKQRKTMIEQWVTQINPNAILRAAMPDVGQGMQSSCSFSRRVRTRCTDYLLLEQLEQYLLGVFYANDFNQRMGRVI